MDYGIRQPSKGEAVPDYKITINNSQHSCSNDPSGQILNRIINNESD